MDGLAGVEASWEVGTSALARALGTTGPPIVVEIAGQSLDDLRLGAERVRDAMAAQPELWNVRSSFEGGPPELRVVLDRTLADGLGVDLDTVAASLRGLARRAHGDRAEHRRRGAGRRADAARGCGRDELLRVPLTTASRRAAGRRRRGPARAAERRAGDLPPRSAPRRPRHRPHRRRRRLPGRAAAAAARRAGRADLPPGLRPRWPARRKSARGPSASCDWAAALALLLVFMVLAGTFESLVHPLTVVASVPLALIGVAARAAARWAGRSA